LPEVIDERGPHVWLIGGPAAGQLIDGDLHGHAVKVVVPPGSPYFVGLPAEFPKGALMLPERTYSARRFTLPGHSHPVTVYADESLRTEADLLRAVGVQLIADARKIGSGSSVSHVAGPPLTIDDRYQRQRCLWCGDVLEEYDLAYIAVPDEQPGPPATWPPGAWVRVEGNAAYVIEVGIDDPMPPDACGRRDAIVVS
jgi:hypothetical protein